MAEQQCLIIIKPDGLIKSLTGNIITALSETKLKIVGAKIVSVKRELAEKHYSDLKENQIRKHGEEKGSQIFENTLKYIMGEFHTNRVLVLVYHGENCIEKIRDITGTTNPEDAHPISIRGKYGRINSKTGVFENVVHASDSEASAKREIQLWFQPDELTETIYPAKTEKIQTEKIVWA
ncbi:MAG: nucleoside-diphosphate kinase [Nanoarchaeota archaeon]|nr:nucleoside-diphosphate kinase [Nanoarchaeota archaeon]MBU4086665.1 nucleoside-diphosphate kinase [Nanoarchaeota archaeon]